jgi:hypothetical protein
VKTLRDIVILAPARRSAVPAEPSLELPEKRIDMRSRVLGIVGRSIIDGHQGLLQGRRDFGGGRVETRRPSQAGVGSNFDNRIKLNAALAKTTSQSTFSNASLTEPRRSNPEMQTHLPKHHSAARLPSASASADRVFDDVVLLLLRKAHFDA